MSGREGERGDAAGVTPDRVVYDPHGVPEPVVLADSGMLVLCDPADDAGRHPGRSRRRRALGALPVAGTMVLLVALVVVLVGRLHDGASGVEAVPATAVSSAPEESTGDPLGVGFTQLDLGCTQQSVVVLASSRRSSSEKSFVQAPLRRFSSAAAPGHYLSVAGSCTALRGSGNKSGSAYLPYLGPFTTPVAACRARIAHTDTSTYVLRLGSDVGRSSNCACSYQAADLPDLSREQDATATGDNRFWVVELQAMLDGAGHRVPKPHVPHYGPATTAAVRELQSDAGLDRTGAMDLTTWRALIHADC